MSTPIQVPNVPVFGRKWNVAVTTQTGQPITYSSSQNDPNALRVTFEIEQFRLQAIWTAKITIYNLNLQSSLNAMGGGTAGQPIVNQGDQITVSAGYQAAGAPYGTIWQGIIYQVLYDKQGGTDYTITFLCTTGLIEQFRNFTQTSWLKNTSQAQIVRQMIAGSRTPTMGVNTVSADQTVLENTASPRGGVMFGTVAKYLTNISATQDNWSAWFDGQTINLGSLQSENGTPDITYAPLEAPGQPLNLTAGLSKTLIGSPQQTQYGVTFKVQLDPRLRASQPPMIVALNMAVIRQLPLQMISNGQQAGQTQTVYPMDQDGQYYVVGIKHYGDTRGNDWVSEVTCVQSLSNVLAQPGQQT